MLISHPRLAATLAALITGTAIVSAQAQGAAAAGFPARPIQLVVPFPPGGVADAIARPLAEKVGAALKQTVVVENRGGATGTIGAGAVAKAEADGYTLLLGTTNEIAMSPTLYRALPYDPTKAFVPVAAVVQFPNVLVVSPAFEATTVKGFVDKVRAQPGRITFASSGPGSTNHLTAELFKQAAKVDIVHVPYKGGGPALTDLMGGHVDAMFATLPSAIGHIKSGKLKAIAVTGEQRSAALPDVPTLAESGLPSVVVTTWNGVLAPARTPPEVLAVLERAFRGAAAQPDLAARYATLGAEPLAWSSAKFGQAIDSDYRKWSGVIRQAGINAD